MPDKLQVIWREQLLLIQAAVDQDGPQQTESCRISSQEISWLLGSRVAAAWDC